MLTIVVGRVWLLIDCCWLSVGLVVVCSLWFVVCCWWRVRIWEGGGGGAARDFVFTMEVEICLGIFKHVVHD